MVRLIGRQPLSNWRDGSCSSGQAALPHENMIKKTYKLARTKVLSSIQSLPAAYADWNTLLAADRDRWMAARESARGGPKVLIANCAGIDSHVTNVESLLAVALTLRGADVHVLLCDEMLPACWMCRSQHIPPAEFVEVGPSKQMCGTCFVTGTQVFQPLGLTMHRYSDLLTASDLQKAAELSQSLAVDDIEQLRVDGIGVGEQAFAGALRYYSSGHLRDEPEGEAILRRYLKASLMSMFAIRRLFRTISFTSVCGIHGMYVPEGIVGDVARSENVRPVSWNDAYRKETFIFSQHDTYHRTLLTEPASNWESLPWTDDMESEVVEYLKSRSYGTHDWIRYAQDWQEDVVVLGRQLGIDFSKPCIGLLTNVIWDAQVCYRDRAFPSMLNWAVETIKYFARRPDLQLIVRVHPAEVRGVVKTRHQMVDEIRRAIPELPKNVFIVPPDSPMNTYATMLKCDAVIIYGTKAGLELSTIGIPVIVAGEAWVRDKGFTLDADSAERYFEILDGLPVRTRMSEQLVQRARKYAYHFFFRRLIPVPVLQSAKGGGLTKVAIAGLEDLLPGKYPGLDVICDGIITGEEFIYPAERYPTSLTTTGKFTRDYGERLSGRLTAKPIVSVIVPTRDQAESLSEGLDSVYAQSGLGSDFEIEVILVDRGSSDDTPRIASQYPGLRYIKRDDPISSAAARNIGLQAASGRYVTFLDDGTNWLPGRLRSQVAILELHPEFGAAYGQFLALGFGEDMIYPDAATAPAGSVFEAFSRDELALPSFTTARRELFDKAGRFDESLDALDHYDMFLRLAASVRFAFVAGAVGTARFSRRDRWARRLQTESHHAELQAVLNNAFSRLPSDSKNAALKQRAVGHWFTEIARLLDRPDTLELLHSHIARFVEDNPWMIEEGSVRDSLLQHTSSVLTPAVKTSSRASGPAVRRLCGGVVGRTDNGHGRRKRPEVRRFLGDTLTFTATQLWNQQDFKAAGYAARCAMQEDPAQVVHQIRAAFRRMARAVFAPRA
jgi:glycosyltransferase involved in cell wall biosynthesis